MVQLIVLFFVAAASAAAIDDAEKKQDKRGVLGLGYGGLGYGGLGYGGLHAPIAAAPIAPLGAYHASLPLAAPAIGMFSILFVRVFVYFIYLFNCCLFQLMHQQLL